MGQASQDFNRASVNGIISYLFFLALFGILFNVIILFLFLKERTLRTPINMLFANLAVSDLIVSIFGTLVSVVVTIMEEFMNNPVLCDLYGFITFLGGCSSLVSVMLIAIERCLVIIKPCNMGNLGFKAAIGFIVFAWLYSLIFAGAPLVGLSRYTPEGPGYWCSVDWESKSYGNTIYIILIFIFVYFIPVIFFTVSYSAIIYKVRQIAKNQAEVTSSTTKAQKGLIIQTVTMTVALLIAWTPYAVVCLIAVYGDSNIITPVVAATPSLFAKSSFVYNPIIYVGLNKQFRNAFIKHILRGHNPFLDHQRSSRTNLSLKATIQGTTQQLGSKSDNDAGPSGTGKVAQFTAHLSSGEGSSDTPTIMQRLTTNTSKVAPIEIPETDISKVASIEAPITNTSKMASIEAPTPDTSKLALIQPPTSNTKVNPIVNVSTNDTFNVALIENPTTDTTQAASIAAPATNTSNVAPIQASTTDTSNVAPIQVPTTETSKVASVEVPTIDTVLSNQSRQ